MRPTHFKELLARECRLGGLHRALTSFTEQACAGKLHPSMAATLCASTLIPLKKGDGGIRPIAVGECLRRLVGKVLLCTPSVKESVERLAPRQTGVCVKKAPELIGVGL